MLIKKAYKFRIYPNQDQQDLIAKTIEGSRFVFNHFLDKWNHVYKETGKGLAYDTCSAGIPLLKKELSWLKEVDSIALQSSVRNPSDSFDCFFRKQYKPPRFKTKNNKVQSYTTKQTNGNIDVINNVIKLPKLGLVKLAKSREITGRIMNATIRRNPSGKYFVSILVETAVCELPKTNSSVGLKKFARLSDETVYENPKFFRTLEKKLAKAQRILSRRKELAIHQQKPLHEAKNYQKQRRIVACIHEEIANKRNDYLHKGTRALPHRVATLASPTSCRRKPRCHRY